ncbi:anti-sigma factor [Kribbella sp. NPDC055071]
MAEDHELAAVDDLLRKDVVWAEPPGDLEERIRFELFGGAGTSAPIEPHKRRRRPILLAAAGLVVAATATGVVAAVAISGGSGRELTLAGTALAPQAQARVHIHDTSSGVEIKLDVRGLPPAGDGQYYEAWVKGSRGSVAIGTFHLRKGVDPVILWSGVGLSEYSMITVTVQKEGGGPASSGQVVLAGEVPVAQR